MTRITEKTSMITGASSGIIYDTQCSQLTNVQVHYFPPMLLREIYSLHQPQLQPQTYINKIMLA